MNRRKFLQVIPAATIAVTQCPAPLHYALLVVPYRALKNGDFKLNGRDSARLLCHHAILVWSSDPTEIAKYKTYAQFLNSTASFPNGDIV